MFKWWKHNKSINIPIDTMNSSNELNKKKKNHSLISFFFNKKISNENLNRKITMKNNPTLTYYHDQSITFNNHSYNYLQIFNEIINKNNSCFGFSLSHITSKYCLYITIIIFLSICLIISLTAIFQK